MTVSYATFAVNDFKNTPDSYCTTGTSCLVKTGAGVLTGMFISTAAGGTFKLYDNTSAAEPYIIQTFTGATATMYDFKNVNFKTGLYLVTTGAPAVTVFFK